jgi:hypothetical protein
MRILAKKEIGLNCSIYFEIDKFFCGIFISTMCFIFVNIHIVLFLCIHIVLSIHIIFICKIGALTTALRFISIICDYYFD